jgi:hypothetical protein
MIYCAKALLFFSIGLFTALCGMTRQWVPFSVMALAVAYCGFISIKTIGVD